MYPGYISKKIALIAGCSIIAVSLVFYTGSLLAGDTICIARKGVQPPTERYDDALLFNAHAQVLREEILGALIRQFNTKTGFFIYEEHPVRGTSNGNNDIRQLLASRVLAKESVVNDELRGLHTQNLNAILETWYREDGDIGYVYWDEKSKLGGNAMLLRTIVASPFFETYRSEAEALMRSILKLQNADGSLKAWYREPDYAYDSEYLLTFYSGEAILALLEYGEKTGSEQAFHAAVRAQEYYLERYVTSMADNYYPAYVPWHTQSLTHLFEKTSDERYAHAVFTLNDKLLEMQDREVFVGRFYDPKTPQYGSPHASSDAVYVEGLAYARELARKVGDQERERKYYDALVAGVHNLDRLQYERGLLSIFVDKAVSKRIEGGVMTNVCNGSVRIDTQAHAVDALTKLLGAG